ncbi:NFACT family protein [Shimazuella sp. AN120528]|uniref:Rqc2 family fibronectin-binding protein n=1 Tax=Shimazuella soli TaxID=1892854 RepID=UPI001F0D9C01|nr:NFACT RNA binding domain-containing protein [Shimazuella soli]MCH5584788.1 NFACT family protein [Shimazuella soli]
MSFDGTVTRAVAHELHTEITNGRITKIYQPSQWEIVFTIRAKGKNHKLMLSCHPVYARCHLTTASYENPAEPPMFCMLLRKQLEGSIIDKIEQVEMERIIHFWIKGKNELGDMVERKLIIEIMGRHSNVILLNPETNKIVDAMRRVGFQTSQYRQVLPGIIYVSPPDQGKINPLTAQHDTFISSLDYNAGQLSKQLVNCFMGLGPLPAEEILSQARLGDRESLWESFFRWQQNMLAHRYEPEIVTDQSRIFYSSCSLSHKKGEHRSFATMSQCLDAFYGNKAERDRVAGQTQALVHKLTRDVEKNKRKIKVLQKEIENSSKAETLRLYGELLTTYLHQINRGDKSITVVNYYDESAGEVTIPLNEALTPNENAQRYFKKYQKLKAGKKYNEEQIQIAKEENEYLESVLSQLAIANLAEVEQIREELTEEGWIKKQVKKGRQKPSSPTPTSYIASDGTTILVGKNNKQNEKLTHHIARKTDTWLHTKDIPGSHVVIRGDHISETALTEAAMLAAYFSKARESSQVPVDYTLVKHVKKPSGARPGFVIYGDQKTIYVTPEEQKLQSILERKPQN